MVLTELTALAQRLAGLAAQPRLTAAYQVTKPPSYQAILLA